MNIRQRSLAGMVAGLVPMAALAAPAPYFPNVPADTVCGLSKMVAMEDESDAVKRIGAPVGRVRTGGGYCSGALIGKDLFLTARHCETACEGISVTFGYYRGGKQETFTCREVVEKGDARLDHDYMILRLDGNPGVAYGWYPLSSEPLPSGQPLLLIHHPQARPMTVSREKCEVKDDNAGWLRHGCDSEPGSSGSAILVPDYEKPERTRLAGVHTLGGCTDDPDSYNSGPSIRGLATVSPLLKNMIR